MSLIELWPKIRSRAPWIAAAIAIVAYYPRFIKDPAGMRFYPAAAECILRGETPLHCKTTLFVYPPFFALLMTPFAIMPMWLRDGIWYLILIVTIFASLKLCEAIARQLFPGDWTERELDQFRILTFVLILKFILAVFENQAYDSLALVCIVFGIFELVRGRTVLASASLATAAALKITPLIFLPYLLLKRRYAGAAVFVVVVVFLTLLPDILEPPKQSWHVTTWMREVVLGPFFSDPHDVALQFWVATTTLNQSFRGAVARIVGEMNHPEQFTIVLRIVSGVYLAGIGLLLVRSMRSDRLIPIYGALLVISALLLSPVSSQSHFVSLMLPYAVLAAITVKASTHRLANALALGASFVLATATSNDVAARAFTNWALTHNLPAWGTLLLVLPLGLFIWSAVDSPAPAPAASVTMTPPVSP